MILSRFGCFFSLTLIFLLPDLAMNLNLEDIINENSIEEETTLTEEDFAKVPEKEFNLTLLGIEIKSDPTMGNMTEGDIILPNFRGLIDYPNNRLERSVLREFYRRWPKAQIPYAISSRYGPYSRSVIAKAMQKFHDISCIRFIPRNHDYHHDYLYILPHDGCYSLVGRAGGRQPISLEADCIQSGTIIHELMHAIGFFHEQSRPDRDNYIEIMWENVIRGAEDQFDKHSLWNLDPLNEPYDYSSIMHYGPYAFSGNGRRTIIALKPGAGRMGQRESLSEIDIRKINKLYSCPRKSNHKMIDENSIEDNGEIGKPILPIKPNDDCIDKSWRCFILSLTIFDYCESNEKIANDLCRKSCGRCYDHLSIVPIIKATKTTATTTTATTTTTTTTTTTKPKIEPIITGITKTKSMGSFGSTTLTCRDTDYSCPILARITDCSNLFEQHPIKNICPYSCGLCSDNNNNSNNDNNNNNRNSNNNKTPKESLRVCEDRGSYITCKLVIFFDECQEKANLCLKTCGGC